MFFWILNREQREGLSSWFRWALAQFLFKLVEFWAWNRVHGARERKKELSGHRAPPVSPSDVRPLSFLFFLLFAWHGFIVSRGIDNSAHGALDWCTRFMHNEEVKGAEFKLGALQLGLGVFFVWWAYALTFWCMGFISCASGPSIFRVQRNFNWVADLWAQGVRVMFRWSNLQTEGSG